MTVYVIRNGELVDKRRVQLAEEIGRHSRELRDDMQPSHPYISRFEPMRSPVDDKWITSWRQRDRDMDAVGKVDPRDLPAAPFERRNIENARRRALDRAADPD
jgi:hypothetical protein